MGAPPIAMRIGLLAISLAGLTGAGAELFVAARLESDAEKQQTACRWDLCDERVVTDSAYHLQLQGDRGPVRSAVGILRGVVARDPGSAQRWIDLGDALAQGGSVGEAGSCFARGLELGKTSADVVLAAGHFYLRYGERIKGLRYLAQTLAFTSRFDDAVFSYFTAEKVPVAEVLQYGMPEERRAAQAYLRSLMGPGAVPEAEAVWDWVKVHNFADERCTVDYVNFLLAQKQLEAAAEAWGSQFGVPVPGYGKTEFLYNGGFDSEPIRGAAFDWKVTPGDHVEITREPEEKAGNRALRVVFDGAANTEFDGVSQRVVLGPGRYRLRAKVRSENLTTDQGVFLGVTDAGGGNRLMGETEMVRGTSDGRELGTEVEAGPGRRLVEVKVMRRASLRFDSKIKGSVWIERVSLERR